MPPRNAVTHERLRTSDQPSCRLARKWSVVACGSSSCRTRATTRGRSGTRQPIDTAKVAASKRKAPPVPATATSSPASTGPTIEPVEKLRPRSALAGWMLIGETVPGSRPVKAGAKNASAAP